jgi:hypothetical protein
LQPSRTSEYLISAKRTQEKRTTRKLQTTRTFPIQNTLRYTKTLDFKAMSLQYENSISRKKPREKELTDKERENNRKMSKVRVKVEHAISGIKRSRTVKDILRNTKDGFSDLVMVIACGLHNFRVEHRKRPLKL